MLLAVACCLTWAQEEAKPIDPADKPDEKFGFLGGLLIGGALAHRRPYYGYGYPAYGGYGGYGYPHYG